MVDALDAQPLLGHDVAEVTQQPAPIEGLTRISTCMARSAPAHSTCSTRSGLQRAHARQARAVAAVHGHPAAQCHVAGDRLRAAAARSSAPG